MTKRKKTTRTRAKKNPALVPAYALEYGTGRTVSLGMVHDGQEAEAKVVQAGWGTCDQPTWVGDAWQITARHLP